MGTNNKGMKDILIAIAKGVAHIFLFIGFYIWLELFSLMCKYEKGYCPLWLWWVVFLPVLIFSIFYFTIKFYKK